MTKCVEECMCMDEYLASLPTENSNKATRYIDNCSTQAMLELINNEDQK